MSTLEWIKNYDMFGSEGLLTWRVLTLRQGLLFQSHRARWLFWERSISGVLGVRIAAAVGLALASRPSWACLCLAAIIATSWFLTERTWLGGDGADQMGQVVSVGALLCAGGLAADELALSFAGTLLIAGQLVISYFFAGLSKLLSPHWRRGQAIVGVMGTHSYGHAFGARVASRSATFSVCLCWLIILTETLFPLAIATPQEVLLFTLAAFFLFHVANAYFMGLNTFVWAFAAAYPSVIVLNALVTRFLRCS